MGKNFGANSKAEEGRARKANAKEAEKEGLRLAKEREEEKKWNVGVKDDSRKQAEEAKRLEKLIRKQETRTLEQTEMSKIKSRAKPSKVDKPAAPRLQAPTSVFSSASMCNWTLSSASDSNAGSSLEDLERYSASNIDDALVLLESAVVSSTSLSVEKHPERRVKAAFAAYEEREMPKLREEFPTLRLGQLMERLHKTWKKAPENPFNQLHVAHNATREDQEEIINAERNRNLDRLRQN